MKDLVSFALFSQNIYKTAVFAVGSLVHGNFNENSDYDLLVVFENKQAVINFLYEYSLIDGKDVKSFEKYANDYFCYNYRTEFNNRKATVIYCDIAFVKEVANYSTEKVFLLRNFIPESIHTLSSLNGQIIDVERMSVPTESNKFISDWIVKIDLQDDYTHGSIVNKLINNPLCLKNDFETLLKKGFANLHFNVNQKYASFNTENNQFLNLCIKSSKFDINTIAHLENQVFLTYPKLIESVLPKSIQNEPVWYALNMVQSNFRSDIVREIAYCFLSKEFSEEYYLLSLKIAALGELHYATSIVVDDIIDGDKVRHNQPTAWIKYGRDWCISASLKAIGSCYMLISEYDYLQKDWLEYDHILIDSFINECISRDKNDISDSVNELVSTQKTYTAIGTIMLILKATDLFYLQKLDMPKLRKFLELCGKAGQLINDYRAFQKASKKGYRVAEIEQNQPSLAYLIADKDLLVRILEGVKAGDFSLLKEFESKVNAMLQQIKDQALSVLNSIELDESLKNVLNKYLLKQNI